MSACQNIVFYDGLTGFRAPPGDALTWTVKRHRFGVEVEPIWGPILRPILNTFDIQIVLDQGFQIGTSNKVNFETYLQIKIQVENIIGTLGFLYA